MNNEAFLKAYQEYRNGASFFVRHPLVRSFIYSDGVQECAEAGCYWLLDLLATEIGAAAFQAKNSTMAIAVLTVVKSKGELVIEFFDGDEHPFKKSISCTDMPEGKWTFYLTLEDAFSLEKGLIKCFLPSEY